MRIGRSGESAADAVLLASGPSQWLRGHVDGVWVDALTIPQLHHFILSTIRSASRARVLHVNVHGLNIAAVDSEFREILNSAELVFCDGSGVMLAAKLRRFAIPQRITYADWMWQLGALAQREDLSFYFLGGAPGVAEEAAAAMARRVPGLRIVGSHHGYFDLARNSTASEDVIMRINESGAQILVTGFGMPIQERWLRDHWDQLDSNIALTGGAVFDYLSGRLQRPLRVFRVLGMEWLGRLAIEPKRLAGRYLIGNPRFMVRQAANLLRGRVPTVQRTG